MNTTKIKNSFYGVSAMLIIVAPLVAQAQWRSKWETTKSASELPGSNNGSGFEDGIKDILTNVMQWLLGIFGALAIIAFVVAGIMFLFSGGDETRATTARKVMVYAIVGVVVAMAGLIIVNFIDAALSNKDIGQ